MASFAFKVVENASLGVDGRLWRVEVLGALLIFVGTGGEEAAAGVRNCCSKKNVADSCRSSSLPRRLASLASPAERFCFGSGMPSFVATVRTASGKELFSIFWTKLKTSPETPHPKQ